MSRETGPAGDAGASPGVRLLTEMARGEDADLGAIDTEVSIAARHILDALVLDDRATLEGLAEPLRRAYYQLAGENPEGAAKTLVFMQGRIATLLECLRLATSRTEPVSWKSHFRDPSFVGLLQFIASKWRRVGDIAAEIHVDDSTATKRLQRLAREGLVVPQPLGREVYYRLSVPARDRLRRWMDEQARSSVPPVNSDVKRSRDDLRQRRRPSYLSAYNNAATASASVPN